MFITQITRSISETTTMAAALVRSGLVNERTFLSEEKVKTVAPIYGWDKAPKAERLVTPTTQEEKEIMEEVPASTPKTRAFRKLLRIAALLMKKLEGIEKRAKALIPRFKEDVINSAEVIRTFKLRLETEDKLASVLDAMGC